MWLIASLGAVAAGLFLILRSALPVLEARRSGKIRTRGHRAQVVLRSDEPERFRQLCRNRLKGAWPGVIAVLAGVGYGLLQVVGVLLSYPA